MKGKSHDLNASVRLSIRKVRDTRPEFHSIHTDAEPQASTQRILNWRNAVDGLHKELEGRSKFLKSLSRDAPSNKPVFSPAVEQFLHSLRKLENEFKLLVNQLKNSTILPRSCEFNSWDLVLQNLVAELHRAAGVVVCQSQEEAFKSVLGAYHLRDSLLAQVVLALVHRKMVL